MKTDHLIYLASSFRHEAYEYLENKLQERGITDLIPAQGALLSMLYAREGQASMKTIVASSGRGKSTITEMAKALERRGYLKREKDTQDARSVLLVLCDKAWAIQAAFNDISEQLLTKSWGVLPQEKRELLIQLLTDVLANMRSPEE